MTTRVKRTIAGFTLAAAALAAACAHSAEQVSFEADDIGKADGESFVVYAEGAGNIFPPDLTEGDCFASDAYDASSRLRGRTALNAMSVTDGTCQRAFWPFVPMSQTDFGFTNLFQTETYHGWTVTQRTARATRRIDGMMMDIPNAVAAHLAETSPFSDIFESPSIGSYSFSAPTYMWTTTLWPYDEMERSDAPYPGMTGDPWNEYRWKHALTYMKLLGDGKYTFQSGYQNVYFDDVPIAQGLRQIYLSEPEEGLHGTKAEVEERRMNTVLNALFVLDWSLGDVMHAAKTEEGETATRGFNIDEHCITNRSRRLVKKTLATTQAGVGYHDRTVYADSAPYGYYTQVVQHVYQAWDGKCINLPKIKFRVSDGELYPAEPWPGDLDLRWTGETTVECTQSFQSLGSGAIDNPCVRYRRGNFYATGGADVDADEEWFFSVTQDELREELERVYGGMSDGTIVLQSVASDKGMKLTSYDRANPAVVTDLDLALEIVGNDETGEMDADLYVNVYRTYDDEWPIRPRVSQIYDGVDWTAVYPCSLAVDKEMASACKLHGIWSFAEIFNRDLGGTESKDALPWPEPDSSVGEWSYGGPVDAGYGNPTNYCEAWIATWDALRDAQDARAIEACGEKSFTANVAVDWPEDFLRYLHYAVGDLLAFDTDNDYRNYEVYVSNGVFAAYKSLDTEQAEVTAGLPTDFGSITAYALIGSPSESGLETLVNYLKLNEYSSDGRMGGAHSVSWGFQSLKKYQND